jgi:thioredoxin-dependent peroxiredoxin
MTLKKGAQLPKFTLPDQDGRKRTNMDYLGKWLVLYFYPKDNTPGCTIEAIDFTKFLPDFRKLSTQVVGVSPDSPKKHCAFIEKQKLKITLLSDETKETLQNFGLWTKKKFMGKEYMGVLRTTLLVNPKGKIVHIWENVQVKGHVEQVLTELKSKLVL